LARERVTRRLPDVVGTRSFPMAGHPDVTDAGPMPIAWHPDHFGIRWTAFDLGQRWGRRRGGVDDWLGMMGMAARGATEEERQRHAREAPEKTSHRHHEAHTNHTFSAWIRF